MNDFDHAGQEMPPILQDLCDQLNADFGLTGDNRFNHCLILCNEQSGAGPDAHGSPSHADKIQNGFFVDISLGYARAFQLLDANTKKVVASQRLASGSLTYISAEDNGRLEQGSKPVKGVSKVVGTRYKHCVNVDPDQPPDQPRFPIVFRAITDHPKGQKCGEHLARVNETKAARVRPGGDLWREYIPLCRGGNGAEPQPQLAPAADPVDVDVVAAQPQAAARCRPGRRGCGGGTAAAAAAAARRSMPTRSTWVR